MLLLVILSLTERIFLLSFTASTLRGHAVHFKWIYRSLTIFKRDSILNRRFFDIRPPQSKWIPLKLVVIIKLLSYYLLSNFNAVKFPSDKVSRRWYAVIQSKTNNLFTIVSSPNLAPFSTISWPRLSSAFGLSDGTQSESTSRDQAYSSE